MRKGYNLINGREGKHRNKIPILSLRIFISILITLNTEETKLAILK